MDKASIYFSCSTSNVRKRHRGRWFLLAVSDLLLNGCAHRNIFQYISVIAWCQRRWNIFVIYMWLSKHRNLESSKTKKNIHFHLYETCLDIFVHSVLLYAGICWNFLYCQKQTKFVPQWVLHVLWTGMVFLSHEFIFSKHKPTNISWFVLHICFSS
jgi:hypothetical protein